MKVLVLADMGQPAYHVGDEAMGIAAADELTQRGFEVVYATRDIAHTRALVDEHAVCMRTLEFPWPPAEREQYLERVRAHCLGEPESGEIQRFVSDLRSVDAIVIAGGGNMNSRYGWLLYERIAYAVVAQAFDIPLYISGQSFGPVLTDHDADLLTQALSSARTVSVRERGSFLWATGRDVITHAGIDDATFYRAQERSLSSELPNLPQEYICATFNGLGDEEVQAVATILDEMVARFSLPTVFLPHMGVPGQQDGDVALHQKIAAAMQETATTVLPMVHADDAARIHRAATLGFATRYHPAIFSLSSGVPFVALLPDAFTDQRVRGAMEQYGAEDYALPLAGLKTTAVFDALAEVYTHRKTISTQLIERSAELRTFSTSYWDSLAEGMCNDRPAALPDLPKARSVAAETGNWRSLVLPLRDAIAQESLAAQSREADLDRALTWDAVHRNQRDEAQYQLEQARQEIHQLKQPAGIKENSRALVSSFKRSLRTRLKR